MGVAETVEYALALPGEAAHRALGVADGDESAAEVVVLPTVGIGRGDALFEVDDRGVQVPLDVGERLRVRERLDGTGDIVAEFPPGVFPGAPVVRTEGVHQSESQGFEFVAGHRGWG